jgi:SET domain-containing protein
MQSRVPPRPQAISRVSPRVSDQQCGLIEEQARIPDSWRAPEQWQHDLAEQGLEPEEKRRAEKDYGRE